jgi:hypothetical protein
MTLRAGPSDARHARRQDRRVLRLARLVFPAIRVGRTRLIGWAKCLDFALPVLPRAFPQISDATEGTMPMVRTILLRLDTWHYRGVRRRFEVTMAYEPTQDVCVALAESVRMWPRTSTSVGEGGWESTLSAQRDETPEKQPRLFGIPIRACLDMPVVSPDAVKLGVF